MSDTAVDPGEGPPAGAALRVLIADDDARVRDALGALIDDEPGMCLVGAATDAESAVALAQQGQAEVAVVDLVMPGGGLQAVRRLRQLRPPPLVIGLSSLGDRASAESMLAEGAARFVAKGSSDDLVQVIWEVARPCC